MRALTFDRSLGRADFGDFETRFRTEWLATNGLGGYAAGTVIGSHTGRYHGLLVAALRPPLGRTLMVAKIDAVARYGTEDYPLFVNEFASGSVDPEGYGCLESFHLEGLIPVWIYALADARLERRIWMAHGQNTTYVSYTLTRGTSPIELTLKPLCTYRDHHSHTRGGWSLQVEPVPGGFEVKAFEGAQPYRASQSAARIRADGVLAEHGHATSPYTRTIVPSFRHSPSVRWLCMTNPRKTR